MSVAAGSTIGASLPMFLAGALAVELTTDLAFGAAGIGLAVAAFRGSTTVTTLFLGPLTDRVGATVAIRLAMVIAAVACFGIATMVTSLVGLVAWMVLGGVGVALGQPAANRLVVTAVPASRQGIAFGVKQGSLPAATMLAGLSVPLVVPTLGWRWAFGIAGLIAVVVVLLVGRRPTASRTSASTVRPPAPRYRTYLVFTVAFTFASLANSVVPAFYVDAFVAAGASAGVAGTVLAIASVAAIVVRVVSGVLSDRLVSGHFKLCAGMLIGGAFGLAMLATGRPGWMAAGVIVALIGTWGFNAVFWFALMQTYPGNPGSVTGAVAPGNHLGGSIGPLAFGLVAQTGSYGVAWGAAGIMAAVSAMIMLNGARIAAEA